MIVLFLPTANEDFCLYHVSKEAYLVIESVLRTNYVNGIHQALICPFYILLKQKSGFFSLVIYEISCLVSFVIMSHYLPLVHENSPRNYCAFKIRISRESCILTLD